MYLKKLSFIAVFMFVVSLSGFANIGENFKQSGLIIGGGASVSQNFGRFLDPTSEYNYTSVSINPSFSFFIVDNLALSLTAGFEWNTYTNTAGDYTEHYFSIPVGFSIDYYAVANPGKNTGFVPAFGLGMSFDIQPNGTYVSSGVDGISDSAISMNLFPYAKFNFFMNDRFAPYILVNANLSFLLSWADESGISYNYDFVDNIGLRAGLYFGFSYFIPNKKKLQL